MADLMEAPAEVVEQEVPQIDAVDQQVDSATDSEASADSNADSNVDQESSEGEPLRGSALWRETKALAAAGKPLTPKLLSSLNKAIHRIDTYDKKYPDGLSAIEKTLGAVQQLASDPNQPIERVIEETLQERAYFRELDDMFTSGNGELASKMADASPELFQRFAPNVFRKFAELNPDGYSALISQATIGYLNRADIPLQFKLLQSFLPQLPDGPAKEQVLNAVETIFGALEGLRGMSEKPILSKEVEGFKFQAPGAEITPESTQAREWDLNRREWNSSVQKEGVNLVFSEAKKAAGKSQLSEKEQQTVLAKVGEELEARLTADRRYGEAMRGYLQAGNRNSYIQRIQSERKKLIPGAVRRAVADVLEARPKGTKTVAKGPQTGKTSQKPQVQGTQQQFRRISGHPKTLGKQVDLKRTPNSMLQRRQAFLVGDKDPVQWG